MKIKCENVVVCGNYDCSLNCEGVCIRSVVALDSEGKCVMCKPKFVPKDGGKPAQNKPNKPFDVEASE